MAKRKTVEELVAELKQFNHHEAARELERLNRWVNAAGLGGPAFGSEPAKATNITDALEKLSRATDSSGTLNGNDLTACFLSLRDSTVKVTPEQG